MAQYAEEKSQDRNDGGDVTTTNIAGNVDDEDSAPPDGGYGWVVCLVTLRSLLQHASC
jgi:hypothetical protein